MRKYRAKTKDGKWVKGWYLEMPGKQKAQIQDEGNGAVSCKLDDAETIPCIAYKGKSPTALDFSKVIPETVGQDTGLKDKGNKEIWKSSLIKVIDEIFVVVWHFNRWVMKNTKTGRIKEFCQINQGFYEVIGNATDNGDLLK